MYILSTVGQKEGFLTIFRSIAKNAKYGTI